ncbi:hypothetical protein [Photobacterium chitinilyticum]|uniref:Uncharacterized protein n=1 Tax=Photobacterium chitinilyticum TaxID=2485123 RepID=A0A3S3UHQ8_9GAMM|nr:hypothetical protein [Photobacterium chitinilyticum]RWX52712.1 hypothetical protein EDI28_25885 [Photobacterium chitinilyticum]
MGICKTNLNLNLLQKDVDENLKLLSIPTTKDVYGTAALAWAMVTRVDAALNMVNAPTTIKMSKINRASVALAGLGAAYWAGAVIGSVARSTYRHTTCSKEQVIAFARKNGISSSWLNTTYAKYPELLNGSMTNDALK